MYPNDPNTTPHPQGVPPQQVPPQYQEPVPPTMPAQSAYQSPPTQQQVLQSPLTPIGLPVSPDVSTAPQPYAPADMSIFYKQQPKKKSASIIGGIIGVAVIACISLWSYFAYNTDITLERYEGDDYSILVPKEYEKETVSDGTAWTSRRYTSNSGKKDAASRMTVLVYHSALPNVQELIRQYDSEQQEILKSIVDGISSVDDKANIALRDIETRKDDHRGLPARTITAKIYNGDSMTGTMHMRTVFTKRGTYVVMVAAHQQVEAEFRESVAKILDSVEIKE